MANTTALESGTLETLLYTITTTDDPSSSPPEFSIVAEALGAPANDPGSWSPGLWFGTWNTSRGTIEAVTPQIGRAPAPLETVDGVKYRMWVRWTAGADQPIKDLGRLYTR